MNFRRWICCLALLLFPPAWAAEVEVRLDKPPGQGTLILQLFDSADHFGDHREAMKTVAVSLADGAVHRITGLPAGEYALMIYYDENANGTLDKNFIGIPREPMAFSNDYNPKGPPRYDRAVFQVGADDTASFDVTLQRPLGERGRIGVGVGVIGQSQPYRGSSGGTFQWIPAITYTGKRIQVLGPGLKLGLVGSGDVRLAATVNYRSEAYEESDSPYLVGMGDSQSTAMGGLSLQVDLPKGFDFSAEYRHDMLGRIDGGEGVCVLGRTFKSGPFRFSPELGLDGLSREIARNDFGVSMAQAREGRPAYSPGQALSMTAGAKLFIEVTDDWLVFIRGQASWLDDEITRSPLVDEDMQFKGLLIVSRTF